MERKITLEGIEYTLRTRTVGEGKILRNRLAIDGYKTQEGVGLGEFQVLSVFTALKSWSRSEPLTQENFENLTPEPHIDRLFEIAQDVNTLPLSEKN